MRLVRLFSAVAILIFFLIGAPPLGSQKRPTPKTLQLPSEQDR